MAEVESEREELTRREAIYRGGRASARCARQDRDPDRRRAWRPARPCARRSPRCDKKSRRESSLPCPSAPPRPAPSFGSIADECVCAIAPENFRAVGLWYDDFAQTSDDEVCDLPARASVRESLMA